MGCSKFAEACDQLTVAALELPLSVKRRNENIFLFVGLAKWYHNATVSPLSSLACVTH